MEPNSIEKQIKQKLNAREIQPSAQAWDRLDAMLSVAENKKEKKSFPWLKVAAGFILSVGFGFYFLDQNATDTTINNSQEIIVETVGIDSVLNDEKNKEIVSVVANENEKDQELNEVEKQDLVQKKSDKNSIVYKDGKSKQQIKIQNSVGVNNTVAVSKEMNTTKSEAESMEVNKEVFIGIQNNQDIVSVEKPIASKSKLKVDPSALLNQVEEEVDLTFRQKIFQKISKNFKEAKESFVSRNQQ